MSNSIRIIEKSHGYTLVYAPKELIEESASRIGVHVSDLQTLQGLQTPEEWKEVFGKS